MSDYISTRLSLAQIASKLHKNSSRQSRNLLAKFSSFLVTKAGGCFLYVKLVLDLVEKGSLSIKTGSFKVVPQNLAEIYQLMFNTKFPSRESYLQVSDIFSICLASLQPLTLEEIFTVLSALSVRSEVRWAELKCLYQTVGDVLVRRSDGTLLCFRPSLRDWLVRRGPGCQHRFLCNPRHGHAAIAVHMSRSGPITSPSRALDLAHHLLKSGLHKTEEDCSLSHRDLTALHLALSVQDITSALTSPANIFSPSARVTRLLLLAGADPGVLTEHSNNSSLLGLYCSLGYTDMVTLLIGEW